MAYEIERKFLVKNNSWKTGVEGIPCRQGYLSSCPACTVRARMMGNAGFITIKGQTSGCSRMEFEYQVPAEDVSAMLTSLCSSDVIEKTRYKVEYAGHIWEIDEFGGANDGLVLAEIELESEDQHFEIPEWLGEEVTHDHAYANSNLAANPFKSWKATPKKD